MIMAYINIGANKLGFGNIALNLKDGYGASRDSNYVYSPQRLLDSREITSVDIGDSVVRVSDNYAKKCIFLV